MNKFFPKKVKFTIVLEKIFVEISEKILNIYIKVLKLIF